MRRRRRLLTLVSVFTVVLCAGAVAVWTRRHGTIETVARETAYTDGFEAVVVDGRDPSTARSLLLADAEKQMRTGKESSFLLPGQGIEQIRANLENAARRSGTSQARVILTARTEAGRSQHVELSFHYGGRTFGYCYEATRDSVRPVWSTFRSLGANQRTEYR